MLGAEPRPDQLGDEVPKLVVFDNDLPREGTGKLFKRKIRGQIVAEQPAARSRRGGQQQAERWLAGSWSAGDHDPRTIATQWVADSAGIHAVVLDIVDRQADAVGVGDVLDILSITGHHGTLSVGCQLNDAGVDRVVAPRLG
jgi:hypothetical protein